jgi:hypothetical protein
LQGRVDKTSHLYLHNWQEDMNMYCSEELAISGFGSLFFLGVALSTLTMKFGDNLGRKNYFYIGAVLNTVCKWALIFWPSRLGRYIFIFLDGAGGFQMFLSYMICAEFFSDEYMVLIAIFQGVVDSVTGWIIPPIYFRYISIDFRWMFIFFAIL